MEKNGVITFYIWCLDIHMINYIVRIIIVIREILYLLCIMIFT